MKATYTLDVKPIIREWLDDVERAARDRKDSGGLIVACFIADNVILSCRNLSVVLEGHLSSYGILPMGTPDDEDGDGLPF